MLRLMGLKQLISAGLCLGVLTGLPTIGNAADETVVDVELALAVDVSLSMSIEELEIQRDGYASALTDPLVLSAIADGVHGKIAVTYFEWAGMGTQRVIIPWTLIAGREDAEAIASVLTALPPRLARRTSISGAIEFAASQFAENDFRGLKRVIDISGDGPNNMGPPVVSARDKAVSTGITINGLPLMTNGGLVSAFNIPDLDDFYTECVIGGPGSFMMPVNDWSQFPEAIRRKLVLELAGVDVPEPGRLPLVRVAAKEPYDCLVGERMWNNRSFLWDDN